VAAGAAVLKGCQPRFEHVWEEGEHSEVIVVFFLDAKLKNPHA